MTNYSTDNHREIAYKTHVIYDFTTANDKNIDHKTVDSFGEEWTKFNSFSDEEIVNIGNEYFDILPDSITVDSYVLDMGCGSGRWSYYLAPKVKGIEAVDPSDAVFIASDMLSEFENVRVTKASAESIPFPDNSFDLVFSLGVLHHIPDTEEAMKRCVEKVKQGGFFLVYLYYSLDNRGFFYKMIFKMSNLLRYLVSKLPATLKKIVCDVLAVIIYMPLVSLSRFLNWIGLTKLSDKIPLAYYKNKSWNVIKNDSLDRFGTPLEQRFSKKQIEEMMTNCGLTNIVFSQNKPYWHAIGQKK